MSLDRHRWLLVAAAAAVVSLSATAQDSATQEKLQEERLVNLVKLTPARDLDSELPKIRFERWLRDMLGKEVELRWEVNDCGEQTGDPAVDRRRDVPACVEAAATLADGRAFGVQVQVGTFGGKMQKPAARFIYLQRGRKLHTIEKLRDLPAALSGKLPQ